MSLQVDGRFHGGDELKYSIKKLLYWLKYLSVTMVKKIPTSRGEKHAHGGNDKML